jgi:hypothetical protein
MGDRPLQRQSTIRKLAPQPPRLVRRANWVYEGESHENPLQKNALYSKSIEYFISDVKA